MRFGFTSTLILITIAIGLATHLSLGSYAVSLDLALILRLTFHMPIATFHVTK